MSNYPTLGPLADFNPQLVADGWDRAVLNGDLVPGYVRVSGFEVDVKFDPKKRAGAHGGHTTFHGLDDGHVFHFEIGLCGDRDLALADAFIKKYVPTVKSVRATKVTAGGAVSAAAFGSLATAGAISGAYGAPLTFDHPSIRAYAPVFAVCVGGGQWEEKPEWGVLGRRCRIKLSHWIPPVAGATVTPKRGGVAQSANASFQRALRLESSLFTRDQIPTKVPPSQRGDAGAFPQVTRQ